MKNNFLSILLLLFVLITLNACSKEGNCNDGIQNNGEQGIDCCGPCETACASQPDCQFTTENPVSCIDGIQNGNETGIDCGGNICPPCTVVDDSTDVVIDTLSVFTHPDND